MEANEAPEKIYFTQTENGTHYYTEGIPFERDYIEYTRTDAFIEKVIKYLYDNNKSFILTEKDIEDLKRHLENT